MDKSHISKELGVRTQAMKTTEMTVRRAIKLIGEFDKLVERFKSDADYTAMDPASYRKVFDEYVPLGQEISQLWERYKRRSLHQEVLDLAENIDLARLPVKTRKEILNGLNRIRKAING